jgi:hypothetical protein
MHGTLLGLRPFKLHTFEIGRSDLESVEQEAGGFPLESFLHDHLHNLADDGLNGVRIFKKGQINFTERILLLVVTRNHEGTILLVVETKLLAMDGGRTALDSVDLDVAATRC